MLKELIITSAVGRTSISVFSNHTEHQVFSWFSTLNFKLIFYCFILLDFSQIDSQFSVEFDRYSTKQNQTKLDQTKQNRNQSSWLKKLMSDWKWKPVVIYRPWDWRLANFQRVCFFPIENWRYDSHFRIKHTLQKKKPTYFNYNTQWLPPTYLLNKQN